MRLVIKDYKQLKFRENLLWVAIVTLVTVLLWIGYTVYRSYNDTTVEKPTQKMLEPLNPSIDKEVFSLLEDRHYPPEDFEPLVLEENEDFIFTQEETSFLESLSSTGSGALLPPPELGLEDGGI